MIIGNEEKILFIGAHPDDIELGCGALISKLDNKDRLYCATMTRMPNHPQTKQLVNEHHKSMDYLGIPKDNISLYYFEERMFHRDRQNICDTLYSLNEDINPSMVFVHPIYHDMHQDHEVVSHETLRIFRETSILGWQNQQKYYYGYVPDIFIGVSENNVNDKIYSLSCYDTYKLKDYMNPIFIESQLRNNGIIIGTMFAEAYKTLRISIK